MGFQTIEGCAGVPYNTSYSLETLYHTYRYLQGFTFLIFTSGSSPPRVHCYFRRSNKLKLSPVDESSSFVLISHFTTEKHHELCDRHNTGRG